MSEEKNEWNIRFLKMALERLYKHDSHLIEQGKERAAAASLACHLRDVLKAEGFFSKFPAIRIDVDYGREGEHPKRNLDGAHVIPDIIIHVPGHEGPNIAAVEIKGWWNKGSVANDKNKLHGYKTKQKYAFAYFVDLNPKEANVTEI